MNVVDCFNSITGTSIRNGIFLFFIELKLFVKLATKLGKKKRKSNPFHWSETLRNRSGRANVPTQLGCGFRWHRDASSRFPQSPTPRFDDTLADWQLHYTFPSFASHLGHSFRSSSRRRLDAQNGFGRTAMKKKTAIVANSDYYNTLVKLVEQSEIDLLMIDMKARVLLSNGFFFWGGGWDPPFFWHHVGFALLVGRTHKKKMKKTRKSLEGVAKMRRSDKVSEVRGAGCRVVSW